MQKKRTPVPKPTVRHPDRKKEADRVACRGNESQSPNAGGSYKDFIRVAAASKLSHMVQSSMRGEMGVEQLVRQSMLVVQDAKTWGVDTKKGMGL